jgi:hypothetical protein
MNTPAASTTRRTQDLTSGNLFSSVGAFIKIRSFRVRQPFHFTATMLIHKKLWTNLIRPQFIVTKQRSAQNMKTALIVIVVIALFVGRFLLERHFGEINTILLIFVGLCLISLIGWLYDRASDFVRSLRRSPRREAVHEPKTSRIIRSSIQNQGIALIARFRKLLNGSPSQPIEELIKADIEHLAATESERMLTWLRSQQSANKQVSLFEYATALAMPSNPTDEEHDDVLLILDDVFCDHTGDLPMKATGAMTIEETIQDMKSYLQGEINKAEQGGAGQPATRSESK